MSEEITCGFLLRICVWTGWPQILMEDLWVKRSIADFVEDLHVNRLTVDSNWRSLSDKINREFLFWICVWAGWPKFDRRFKLKIYEWQDQSRILVEDLHVSRLTTDWPQIKIEDLWVTRSIADFCWGSACEQIDHRLTVDSNSWSMSDKINRGFLLKICVWISWIRYQWIKRQLLISGSGVAKVAQVTPRWIWGGLGQPRSRAVDRPYMESPDVRNSLSTKWIIRLFNKIRV